MWPGLEIKVKKDPGAIHLDFNVKPAKTHQVANAFVGGGTKVTTGPRKHRKILKRSEGYLPSTRGYSDCAHEYGPPIPTRYSFDGRPVRANPAIISASRPIVKLLPGSKSHQILSVLFYQTFIISPTKPAWKCSKVLLRYDVLCRCTISPGSQSQLYT
jgi:hypothetical protein